MLTSIAPQNTGTTQSSYIDVVRNLAYSNGCAFFDLNKQWLQQYGTIANVESAGLITSADHIHPTLTGHADIAARLRKVLGV